MTCIVSSGLSWTVFKVFKHILKERSVFFLFRRSEWTNYCSLEKEVSEYWLLFFLQLSGILNPWIWLTNRAWLIARSPAARIFTSGSLVCTTPRFPALATFQAFVTASKASSVSNVKCKSFRKSQRHFRCFVNVCVALSWSSLLIFISSSALVFNINICHVTNILALSLQPRFSFLRETWSAPILDTIFVTREKAKYLSVTGFYKGA